MLVLAHDENGEIKHAVKGTPGVKSLPTPEEIATWETHTPESHAVALLKYHPGWAAILVEGGDLPDFATHKVVDGAVVAKSPEEIAGEALAEKWVGVRAERNRLLSACDWTRLDDAAVTVEQRAAWATYRQALRDVPQNNPDPSAVVWPKGPA